jgi:phospholipase C
VLQFLEARFGVQEPNISAWRRAVCGDLTAAFDFSNRPEPVSVQISVPMPARTRHQPYRVPREQQMPRQESGTRRSRALPYTLMVDGHGDGNRFWIQFINSGRAGAAFAVHDGIQPEFAPRRYALSAGDRLIDAWQPTGQGRRYDLTVYGPHGYLRRFRGTLENRDLPEGKLTYLDEATVLLTLTNSGTRPVTAIVEEHYSRSQRVCAISPGEKTEQSWSVEGSSGWYDLAITASDQDYLRRFAGHLENGRPSTSDPASYSEV